MIRPAQLNDVDQIAALLRASFDAKLHDFMVYAQYGIKHFIEVHIGMPILKPTRRFLVDVEGDRLRAFAEFQEGADDIVLLSYICVAEEARGIGLATELIATFLTSVPCSTVLQLDVFAENQPALALYNKLGFEQIGSTGWFVRDLPSPSEVSTPYLTNALEASAMYARYGFCRYAADWQGVSTSFGRIGARTIRCFSYDDFANDQLLRAIHGLFTEAKRALLICSMEDSDRPDDALLFHTSLRLARNNLSKRENHIS